MKYVLPYKTVKFTNESMDTVDSALKNPQFEDGTIGVTQNPEEAIDILGEKEYKELLTTRSSKVSWIDDPRLTILLHQMVENINRDTGWNFNVSNSDPIQYTVYNQGDHYNWHTDQSPPDHRNQVRKISMTLFLNEEYEGGELDLELGSPLSEDRNETFKLTRGNAIFFTSDIWHRVRPVTSGVRKSLVAWFTGRPYV